MGSLATASWSASNLLLTKQLPNRTVHQAKRKLLRPLNEQPMIPKKRPGSCVTYQSREILLSQTQAILLTPISLLLLCQQIYELTAEVDTLLFCLQISFWLLALIAVSFTIEACLLVQTYHLRWTIRIDLQNTERIFR